MINALNLRRSKLFQKFLDTLGREPRIAWYPSAGTDFRDLLYLSQSYARFDHASQKEPDMPDLFLHSDYFPWSESPMFDSPTLFLDKRTQMRIVNFDALPNVSLPLDPEIVDFPNGSDTTGRVAFFEVDVSSKLLGEFRCPVLYVFSENAAFCAEVLLKDQATVTHIVHVRYGGGIGGGGRSTGARIPSILNRLRCEVFLTDGHLTIQSGDERAMNLFPQLRGTPAPVEMIRTIPGRRWSNHGDVSWNLVGKV